CLSIIEDALDKTSDTGSRARIEAFFKVLASKAVERKKIGATSTWLKVVEASDMQATVDDLLQEINDISCIRGLIGRVIERGRTACVKRPDSVDKCMVWRACERS
ncbi:hypothetical protein BDV98DRAFT_598066, partial [Pterulicium gracile]